MPDYLTQADRQNFGDELIDLAQRSAMHAVSPHLQQLEEQNSELRNRLARETKKNLDLALEREGIPWQQINQSPRFLVWLEGKDTLSGCVRQTLLNDAVAKGDAARVINFFRGFMAEEGVAGQHGQAGSRPAAAAGGQLYSRQQIVQMARERQKGRISDEQWRRWEYELCRASAEGRVVGALSLDDGVPLSR